MAKTSSNKNDYATKILKDIQEKKSERQRQREYLRVKDEFKQKKSNSSATGRISRLKSDER